MKKAFQKTLVAAVVASASFAALAGGGTPATDNLLFPYISTKASAQTFLSIVARDTALPAVGTAAPVHITYVTRPIAGGTCSHYDGDMSMTSNDQMTFEVSGRTDVNAATGDTTSTPVQLPAIATDRIGFAIVNNNVAGAYGTGAIYGNLPLYGEARVVDTATGLYLGYSSSDLHTLAAGNPDFAVVTGQGPDASIAPALYVNKLVNWFSTGAVDTTWFVLPLNTEALMAFAAPPAQTITYQVQNAAAGGVGGHYNNNEVFRSSTATYTATCIGSVSRATLLDPIVATHSVNGGWGTFVRTAGATNALVYKNEVLQPGILGGVGQFVTRVPVL